MASFQEGSAAGFARPLNKIIHPLEFMDVATGTNKKSTLAT
jgi:hypothetical protein